MSSSADAPANTHASHPCEDLSSNPEDYPTVTKMWEETLERFKTREALKWKNASGSWESWTYQEYYDNIRKCTKSFIHLGLEAGKAVNLIGFNSKEWFVGDMAAIFAGGRACGIYTSNSPDQCHYVAEHSEAQIVCVENDIQLRKFLTIFHRLPDLKAIIVMDNTVKTNVAEALKAAAEDGELPEPQSDSSNGCDAEGNKVVYTWEEMMALCDKVEDAALEERINAQKPTDVCTLIYTSGTTGNPKGVMLSHANITFTVTSLTSKKMNMFVEHEHMLTYLPLSHIAEQIVSLLSPLKLGTTIYFCDASVLRGSLAQYLQEVRPTSFLGVPRVWEKIQAKIQAKGAQNGAIKKMISSWARGKGLQAGYAMQRGEPLPFGYGIANSLVFSKVRDVLGFDRCRNFITSAAPISLDTLEFFLSLGIPLLEVFGMSECCGPASISWPNKFKTGWAGIPLPGSEMKIAEDGELCVKGLNVTVGYFKNPDATAETIDSEGWLHTGDIATIDNDGFVKITDRKKELIITAGGENIAPAVIEGFLRGVPVINQAVVIGDRRKFLSCLVTLDPERVALEIQECGATCEPTAEAASNDQVFKDHLWKQIEAVNARLARVQTIKKFAILPKEFTPESGELTPTMKLKRRIINQKYEDVIEGFYAE